MLETFRPVPAFVLFLVLSLAACATIPGETGAEQAEAIDSLVERTLADLYAQEPETRDEVAASVGYIIMSNKITKIPLVGAGAGYGVGIDNRTGERTYLKMSRFDLGAGWGARSVRPVLIFQSEELFKDFTDGEWEVQAGAEAAAKAGDSGGAGGGASKGASDKGYSVHMITDAGVSATATVAIIRVKPVKLKE